MANQQLVDYIKSQVKAGVTKEDLVKAIQAAGWSSQDMQDAFAVSEGKAPATPVQSMAPVQPAAAQPVQPVQPQAQPVQPIPSQVQTTQPAARPAATPRAAIDIDAAERAPLWRNVWLWVVVAAVVLIVLIGVAYAFVPAVKDIVHYYLGGGVQASTEQTALPEQPAAAQSQPIPTATTTPGATASSTTPAAASSGATAGVSASSTASTTLH